MTQKRHTISSSRLPSVGSRFVTDRQHEHDARTSLLERLESVPLRFLRFQAVRDRTGLSRSTIWRLERRGQFPRHRHISTNAVGWLETEVNDWVLARAANT